MLRINFEWLEFAFKCFKSALKGVNLHLNASTPYQKVQIYIRILQMPFEWIECAFACFKSGSNG